MAKIGFDAAKVKPFIGPPHCSPQEWALRLWLNPPDDLAVLCAWATVDKGAFNSLQEWAIRARQDLDDVTKVALFNTLMRKPPKSKRASRDQRLRVIAASLQEHYSNLPRKPNLGGVSDILAGLPGLSMSAESIYNKILTGK